MQLLQITHCSDQSFGIQLCAQAVIYDPLVYTILDTVLLCAQASIYNHAHTLLRHKPVALTDGEIQSCLNPVEIIHTIFSLHRTYQPLAAIHQLSYMNPYLWLTKLIILNTKAE